MRETYEREKSRAAHITYTYTCINTHKHAGRHAHALTHTYTHALTQKGTLTTLRVGGLS